MVRQLWMTGPSGEAKLVFDFDDSLGRTRLGKNLLLPVFQAHRYSLDQNATVGKEYLVNSAFLDGFFVEPRF